MSDSSLITAKYVDQARAAEASGSARAARPQRGFWERANAWVSLALGAALIAGAALLAAPHVTAARSAKTTRPIDWLLRLGGAKPDQTFERYLQDSIEANQREFDEAYRESPVFGRDFDFESLNAPYQAKYDFE